jgi:hypothetical protein
MKKLLTIISILIFISLTHFTIQAQSKGNTKPTASDTNKKSNLTYTIIPASNNTWCYDIYKDGRLYIHQQNIPGMAGNEGFKRKEFAMKVAKLVIEKIEKGQMPPTITIEEMKQIKVL